MLASVLAPVAILRWPDAAAPAAYPQLPPTGAAPLAPDGSARLVRAQTDVYLVTGRTRRWVADLGVFEDYRFRWEQVELIDFDALSAIPRGPDLIAGPVLQAPTGDYWIVYQGARRRVAGSDAFAALDLSPADAVPATAEALGTYPIGRPLGNPHRPWLPAAAIALAVAAIWLWWQDAAWPALALVLVASTSLKVCFVLLFPWFADGADGPAYVAIARYLGSGGSVLADGPFGGLIGVTAPGYPILLALVSPALHLTGGSVIGWKLVQVGLAALLALLVMALAARVCGTRAARAALLVAATSPVWFLAAEVLQYEIWLAALIAAGTWALFRSEESAHHARPWLAVSGLLLGVACLVQLKVVAVCAVFAVYLVVRVTRTAGARRVGARALAPAVLFGAVAAVPVAAWVARNAVVHRELLIGTTGPAPMLWVGNHLGATGGYMQMPRPDRFYDLLRLQPEGSITREARAFAALGWEVIREHPTHFAYLALVKLERFWWTLSPDRYGAFAEGRAIAFLGGVFDHAALLAGSKLLNAATLATALAGLFAGWGAVNDLPDGYRTRARARRWLIVGVLGVFWVVHIPFISEPRYRIGVAPLVQVMQGIGLAVLGGAVVGRRSEGRPAVRAVEAVQAVQAVREERDT